MLDKFANLKINSYDDRQFNRVRNHSLSLRCMQTCMQGREACSNEVTGTWPTNLSDDGRDHVHGDYFTDGRQSGGDLKLVGTEGINQSSE